MAKLIIEIDDNLKKKLLLKIVQQESTQKEIITDLVKKYVNDDE